MAFYLFWEKMKILLERSLATTAFPRNISLPDEVDLDKDVEAKYKGGILKMNLKKRKGEKAKKAKTVNVS